LVLPDISLPYYAEITKELNAKAYSLGYQLLIATTDLDVVREDDQLQSLASRRVDGIILMSVDPDRDLSSLERLDTPVVVIDRPEFAMQSARAATEHLIRHGHTKIGFIGGRLRVSDRRLNGWSTALHEAGLQKNEAWIISTAITREGGYSAAQQILQAQDPPTALLVGSDAQASGVLRAIKDLKLTVPRDIALITSEGTDLASYTVPSLTSIIQPIEEIAREAVDNVLAAKSDPVRRVDIATFELALRESCGHEKSEVV
jgi:LacI family transcriptional regulator